MPDKDGKEDDKLGKYRDKRDAGVSPEPTGEELPPGAPRATRTGAFVVHLHDASRTHYDLRLEVGGVLASFAVPKGPGLDPNEKQLAIQTEEHPIEYIDFEAVIPKGNYGAGPMICWDRGMVRYLETTAEQGLATGKLDFTLSGYKLRGRYALVKLEKSVKGNEWLLIKKNDAFVNTTEDVRTTQPRSVLSGLTVDELERAPAMAAEAEELAAKVGALRGEVDGRAISPMLCSGIEDRGGEQPTSHLPAWLKENYTYELKLDGVRVIADKRAADVHLTYRSNRDTTLAYPEVERAVQALALERVVLDGEIVAFDDKGVPNFQRLSQRIHLSDDRKNKSSFGGGSVGWAVLAVPVVYLVFDILAVGGYDLRALPLLVRRDLLRRVVPGTGVIRALDYLEGGGDALLDFCRARHLEGIVAKRADAPYRAGPKRTADWVKVKCERDESFVVIGYTRGNEGRNRLGALDLGAYDENGELVVRGKVGSGLDEKTIDMLLEKLVPLHTKERLFGGKLDSAPNGRTLVKPQIVVSVRYLGWSDEGRLRFPSFRGVDYDRAPTDCVAGPHGNAVHLPSLEAPRFRKEAEQRQEAARAVAPEAAPPSSGATSWRSSHPLKRASLTNQTKPFWPPSEGGYTKGDVCKYYEKVSTVLLPYLRDRPVILVRYPDGIHGKSFFQWNVPWGFPAWIRHIPLGGFEDESKSSRAPERSGGSVAKANKRVFLINDLDSLLTVANLGAIPLHVLASRAGSLDECDFCTLDFDVDRSTLQDGVTLALELRSLLDEIGLRGYPKTSGQHGLHVLIPLGRGVTFDTAQALNVLLGRLVTARHPDIATLERVVERRGTKVLVDIGQTGPKRTIVSPYSLRAHPGATASTPLEWDEVNASLDPSKLDIRSVPERIARIGDPMRGLLSDAPDVASAVQRLGAIVQKG